MYMRLLAHLLGLHPDASVVRDIGDITDYTQGHRIFRIFHIGKHHVYTYIVSVGIMSKDIVFCDAFLPYCHDLETEPVQDEPLVPVLPENHFLPMPQDNRPVRPVLAVRYGGMSSVVENHAVGKHLHD